MQEDEALLEDYGEEPDQDEDLEDEEADEKYVRMLIESNEKW